MAAFSEQRDRPSAERQIRSLSDQSGAPLAHVRVLFSDELARLKMGAKVGTYLGVLTASNVRGMLRRKARQAADAEVAAAATARKTIPHVLDHGDEG